MIRIPAFAFALSLATPAMGHPHVFIGGGADFNFAPDGTLASIHVTWIYDEYYSMTLLLDYGLDPEGDGRLEPNEKAFLADNETAHWQEGYEGDGYLLADGVTLALGKPEQATADVTDGMIVITFDRPVVQPFRPGPGTEFKAYDPTYYVAYEITKEPVLVNAAGCTAELVKFNPDAMETEQLQQLSQLGVYDNPADMNIGESFADRIVLSCD